jgi:hypothetical protein
MWPIVYPGIRPGGVFWGRPPGPAPQQPEKQSSFTIGPIVTQYVADRIPGYRAGGPKIGFRRACAPRRIGFGRGCNRVRPRSCPNDETVCCVSLETSGRPAGAPELPQLGNGPLCLCAQPPAPQLPPPELPQLGNGPLCLCAQLLAPQLPPPGLPQLGNGPLCLSAQLRPPSCRPRGCRNQETVRSVSAPSSRPPSCRPRSCREQPRAASCQLADQAPPGPAPGARGPKRRFRNRRFSPRFS